jgi:hypothetical protein
MPTRRQILNLTSLRSLAQETKTFTAHAGGDPLAQHDVFSRRLSDKADRKNRFGWLDRRALNYEFVSKSFMERGDAPNAPPLSTVGQLSR